MVKIGLTLIAFPLPIVIDDVLGWAFVAGGLIQRRMKNSALYLEDVNKIFPDLVKELQEIKQEIVWLQRWKPIKTTRNNLAQSEEGKFY